MARSQASEDLGKALLRIVLGALILLHGIFKLTHAGAFGFVTKMVAHAGLPEPVAYLVYVGEIVAPVLLIIGLWSRLAALVVAVNMLFALALVHTAQLGMLNENGGWQLELQAMYLVAAIAVALFGAGRFSVGGPNGPMN